MMLRSSFIVAVCAVSLTGVHALSALALRPPSTVVRSKVGVEIELPDFDALFEKIGAVSPLAQTVLNGKGLGGLSAIPESTGLHWKTVEQNARKVVHSIERIDQFEGFNAPMMRFRSSIQGPCIGEAFAQFIMDLDTRKLWDTQIDDVKEVFSIHDLSQPQRAMGNNVGDCTKLGVGHCKTKAGLGVSPREQLTLCGIQEFANGSYIIWGKELTEAHDYLFPKGKRETRAKSHLFATTLTPTSDESFDVEYLLQLEIGGKLPTWLTTPIVTESVKRMFSVADKYFADKSDDSKLNEFLRTKAEKMFAHSHGVLMTP